MSDYADLSRRLRQWITTPAAAIKLDDRRLEDDVADAVVAIEAQARQIAAPLPEEIEYLARILLDCATDSSRSPTLEDCDRIAGQLRSLARQVAEKDEQIAAQKEAGKALYAATDKLIAEHDALLEVIRKLRHASIVVMPHALAKCILDRCDAALAEHNPK